MQFMAGWFFNHEELNPNACPLARKKDGSSSTSCFACNASSAGLGFNLDG